MRLTPYRNLSALVTCHTLYVVFDLAECCVFVKQSVDPVTETLLRGHPLFQSYGVRLPSSLTRFHSYAFALLRDPTCVGLVRTPDYTPSFSCGARHDNFAPAKLELALSGQAFDGLLLLAHQGRVKYRRSRNISLVSIVVAVWVQLRIRLDLGGQSLPRRPWGIRRPWIQQGYRYSCLHSHLLFLNRGLRHGNTDNNAPLPIAHPRGCTILELRYTADRQSLSARRH